MARKYMPIIAGLICSLLVAGTALAEGSWSSYIPMPLRVSPPDNGPTITTTAQPLLSSSRAAGTTSQKTAPLTMRLCS